MENFVNFGEEKPNDWLTELTSWCSLNKDPNTNPGVLQGKEFLFSGSNPQFSLDKKKKTITDHFFHSSSNRLWVHIKYKKYEHESDASAGFGLLIKLIKTFQQNSRSFPGVQGNDMFFRSFPGVQGNDLFFRSFPGVQENYLFFRSFPGVQGNYLFFRSFAGLPGVLSTMYITSSHHNLEIRGQVLNWVVTLHLSSFPDSIAI